MNTGNYLMKYNFPRKRTAIKAGTYSLSKMQKIVTGQAQ